MNEKAESNSEDVRIALDNNRVVVVSARVFRNMLTFAKEAADEHQDNHPESAAEVHDIVARIRNAIYS